MLGRGKLGVVWKSDETRRVVYWAIWLTAAYIAAQVIADVAATKIVQLFGVAIPGGSLVFALTFTLRDLLHKKLGKQAALYAIWAAVAANIVMALTFQMMIALPPAVFWENQAAYALTLGSVWYIVIASIVAELVSEIVDTELFHIAWTGFAQKRPWLQVTFSNLVSSPLDSVIFGGLAFGVFPALFPQSGAHALPLAALWAIIVGQTLFKWAIGLVIMPTIYLIRE